METYVCYLHLRDSIARNQSLLLQKIIFALHFCMSSAHVYALGMFKLLVTLLFTIVATLPLYLG